jgi:hypothetical protein
MGSIKTIMFGRLNCRDTVRAGMVSVEGPIIHLLQMHQGGRRPEGSFQVA